MENISVLDKQSKLLYVSDDYDFFCKKKTLKFYKKYTFKNPFGVKNYNSQYLVKFFEFKDQKPDV